MEEYLMQSAEAYDDDSLPALDEKELTTLRVKYADGLERV